jgi:hypothetical protein
MKKLLFSLSLFTISVAFFSCKKQQAEASLVTSTQSAGGSIFGREDGQTCPTTTVALIAGQTINAGNVTVTNDANFIYVTYNTANGYVLTKTHLYVGGCDLIPLTNSGNPRPGQFPYKTTHSGGLTTYTYQVPISAIPALSCGCIAAHSQVVKYGTNGAVIDQQTAWGNGTAINASGNWGMKFDYCRCN